MSASGLPTDGLRKSVNADAAAAVGKWGGGDRDLVATTASELSKLVAALEKVHAIKSTKENLDALRYLSHIQAIASPQSGKDNTPVDTSAEDVQSPSIIPKL